MITGVEVIAGEAVAGVETEVEGTEKKVIANIEIEQERITEWTEGEIIFGNYKVKIIEKDKDTENGVEGVTYKITQKATRGELSTTLTATKTTNASGEIQVEAKEGDKLTLRIRRTKVPSGYKLKAEEIIVNLIKNAEGNYELETEVEGVRVDTTNKLIVVDRKIYNTNSEYNEARKKVNNTIYITKVDEELRPLQGVTMQLREMSTGKTWDLTTDDNGLAKISSEELVQQLGNEFPQYLTTAEGKLTFWITEKTVPVGYESIEEDIGFEAYYEYTPEGVLEMSYMNVLDGLSYYHIVNQEYDQYEADEYTQVDMRMKVINRYGLPEGTPKSVMRIEKVDSENNAIKLANANFQITLTYPTGGKVRTTNATRANGILDISNLYFPEGTTQVEIIEKAAPNGYVLDSAPRIIKVTNTAGEITVEGAELDESGRIKVEIENTKQEVQQTYNVVVQKRDKETEEIIDSTAEFNVRVTRSGYISTYSRSTIEGKARVTGLNGKGSIKIEVQETEAPVGYKLNNNVTTAYIRKESLKSGIAIDESKEQENVRVVGNTIYIDVYNERNQVVSEPILQIKKVDNNNRNLGLEGAKFSITMPDARRTTRTVITSKTGYSNVIISNAITGRYIVEEITAPVGYNLAKKIALDITFDENKNITSCEIAQNLGTEYTKSVISKEVYGKRINLTIGDSRIQNGTIGTVSTYTIKIDKVSTSSDNIKLDGAKFDINIEQQNGTNYTLTKETEDERGISIYGLTGTGKIKVALQELRAPAGYVNNAIIREVGFTRNAITKQLQLDPTTLNNLGESDIEINNRNHTITIKVKNSPRGYIPPIREDGTTDPTPVTPGTISNNIIIENEDIENYETKIEGPTFKIYKLNTYVSQGKTNKNGQTTISVGARPYNTTVNYLIRNTQMEATRYIRNEDVVLQVEYNASGTMQGARFITGEGQTLNVDEQGRAIDGQGRIVAEVDRSINYVGTNRIKVKIRCKKTGYTTITTTPEPEPVTPTPGTPSNPVDPSNPEKPSKPGTTPGGTTREPEDTIKPEEKPSPVRPVEGEADFGIEIEKVNTYNNRIKVENAKYSIYVLNESTNESTNTIGTTNAQGKLTVTGLLGYGDFKITLVEIASPEDYAIDENRHEIRINRDEESQMIRILEGGTNAENITTRVDNINKIVKMTIEEAPSTIGFAILKQDYEDESIGLKNSKFEIVDPETNETYELKTGEEGMGYTSLPIKENGTYTFKIREVEAPVGYNAVAEQLNLEVTYLNGLIASAEVTGNEERAYITNQTEEYIEVNVLNSKKEEGMKYDVELIKADAYYSGITFQDAKIKIDIDNEVGMQGITKTALTDEEGKMYINNIYGSGHVVIKITEIEPPAGRRFDTKEKQVILNINQENGWIKLDKLTKNVDTFIDNKTKKITIRIRNYPDGTFTIGANKVDNNDNSLILLGAKYKVQMEGSETEYEIKEYKNGLLALNNIPMPTSTGIYTYTITEVEAPFGYELDTTPTILKVEVRKERGITVITNAYIESGKGQVEKYGDEYVHLRLEDTAKEVADTDKYNLTLNKVDRRNHEYVIPETAIGIQVEAESGERYYKTVETDEKGQIHLNGIRGTGRIKVTVEEIESAQNYIKEYGT